MVDRTMKYYPGLYMVEIDRIVAAEKRFGDRFLRRLLTPVELTYCGRGAAGHQRLACRIAAKIAVRSALRMAGLGPIPWLDLEVKRDEWGKPSIDVKESWRNITKQPTPPSILLSLSHSRDLAVASAIVGRE
jgi:holo-[acyl-carrier protein] synthase